MREKQRKRERQRERARKKKSESERAEGDKKQNLRSVLQSNLYSKWFMVPYNLIL